MADGGERTVTHTHPHWHSGGGEYHPSRLGRAKGDCARPGLPPAALGCFPPPSLILISNKMLYLKSRVFHTLVLHVPCVTPSHKNLTRLAL